MIYFIQTHDPYLDPEHGPIKIGYSDDNLRERVKILQIGNPYHIRTLGTMMGNLADEKQLHKKFEFQHMRGEWFKWSQELQQFITDKCAGGCWGSRPTRILLPDLTRRQQLFSNLGLEVPAA